MKMKNVLITGATGFIGRNLLARLSRVNINIYVLVFPEEMEKIPEKENIFPVMGDLSDISSVEDQLKEISFDTIYHLAWEGVSTTYKNDYNIQIKNIRYAMNVMELARNHGNGRVIITGSISEYAYCDSISQEMVPAPSDFYSASKAAIHILCDFYVRLYGTIELNWAIISSIYGPGRIDNNIVTYTIKTLLEGKDTEYTKLEQKWDYVYIDDVIEALVLIGERGIPGKMYQIGSGEIRPLSEYVQTIKNCISPETELGIGRLPYKTGKIDNSVVDIRELVSDTGYCPQTSFECGIDKTIKYFRETEKSDV